MTPSGSGTVVQNGSLMLSTVNNAKGSASNSAFPSTTASYELTFNLAFTGVPLTATKKLITYGALVGNWKADGNIELVSGVTGTSTSAPLAMSAGVSKKYKVVVRRVYRTTSSLSTLEVFVDGVNCFTATGTALATHNLGAAPVTFTLGDAAAAYAVPLYFDDVRIDLPVKGTTEPHLWPMASSTGVSPNITTADSGSGAVNLTYAPAGSTPTHDVAGTYAGYFQTMYGSPTYSTSYYSATSVARSGFNMLATGLVKPVVSLATATGGSVNATSGGAMTAPWSAANISTSYTNTVELMTVGNTAVAGSYVSVWAWRGGKILMFTGLSYIETSGVVVGSSEFVLGVRLTATEPVLYINGAVPAMTALGWRTMTNVSPATNTIVQLKKLYAEEIGSDPSVDASETGITIRSSGKIDLVPNVTNGNSIDAVTPPTIGASDNQVTVHGDLQILGAVISKGALADYTKNASTTETENTIVESASNHLLLEASSAAMDVIVQDSRFVAHRSATTSTSAAVATPDIVSVRAEHDAENREIALGLAYNTNNTFATGATATGKTAWRGVIDSAAADLEIRSDTQMRVSADRYATGEVRLGAGSTVTLAPKIATPGLDPLTKVVVQSEALEVSGVSSATDTRGNHAYSTDAVTIVGRKGVGNAGAGGNLWITGDTDVPGSGVAIEQTKFVDSSVSTTNKTLALSAATNVSVEKDLVLKSTDGDGGKVSTSGNLYLNPASGVVKVRGDVLVDGTLASENTTVTKAVVLDKTLSLANAENAVVAAWNFDEDSLVSAPSAATPAGVTMTLANAVVSGGVVTTRTANVIASGTANDASFPKNTDSYEVSFVVSFASPLAPAVRLFSYGTMAVLWLADDTLWIWTTDPFTTGSSTSTFVPGKHRVVVRRVHVAGSPALSTLEVYIDGSRRIGVAGAIATHDLGPNPSLVLGGDNAGYDSAVSFDEVRVESVTAPTNTAADGAGILVEGNGVVNSKTADRSIRWSKNVTQEMGDETGSYWHVKGGQIMLTRTIDVARRKAPGSDVTLADLPVKVGTTTEPHMWKMATTSGTTPNCTTPDAVDSLPLTHTASSGTGGWLGDWQFNADLLNSGTGTAPSFTTSLSTATGEITLPTVGSGTGFPCPHKVQMTDMNFSSVSGWGSWTVEISAKTTNNAGGVYAFFTVGQDGTSTSSFSQIVLYGIINSVAICTESNGYTNRILNISNAVLNPTGAITGAPNNGGYHTYKLVKKYYNVSGVVSNPSLLFDFYYDGKLINISTPFQTGITQNGDLPNPPVGKTPGTDNILMLGGTYRRPTDNTTTVTYVKYDATMYVSPNHTSGYFQTMYGTAGYKTSYYSAVGFTRPGGTLSPGTGLLFTGVVKPVTSFALATGGSVGTNPGDPMTAPFACSVVGSVNTNANMVELFAVGNVATAGAYVNVWVWRGGKILLFNGSSYIETADAVVSASEFTLGIRLQETTNEPILYINGAIPAMTAVGWRATSTNLFTSTNTSVTLSGTASQNGIYLGARTLYVSGTAINAAFKNWRVVDTLTPAMTSDHIAKTQLYRYADEYDSEPLAVTYGFRIADDETLQFVKTQGSATTSTLFGKPWPAGDDAGGTTLTDNTLGTIEAGATDVVLELRNNVV
eukprot:jgi/Mesvir1/10359/Mv10560-RA.1